MKDEELLPLDDSFPTYEGYVSMNSIQGASRVSPSESESAPELEERAIQCVHPGSVIVGQSLIENKKGFFDLVYFDTPRGEKLSMYFDVTGWFSAPPPNILIGKRRR